MLVFRSIPTSKPMNSVFHSKYNLKIGEWFVHGLWGEFTMDTPVARYYPSLLRIFWEWPCTCQKKANSSFFQLIRHLERFEVCASTFWPIPLSFKVPLAHQLLRLLCRCGFCIAAFRFQRSLFFLAISSIKSIRTGTFLYKIEHRSSPLTPSLGF